MDDNANTKEFSFTGDYAHSEMVKRAVLNAKPNRIGTAPRWVALMDTFAYGSTTSRAICKAYGLDPDKLVNGVECEACLSSQEVK